MYYLFKIIWLNFENEHFQTRTFICFFKLDENNILQLAIHLFLNKSIHDQQFD